MSDMLNMPDIVWFIKDILALDPLIINETLCGETDIIQKTSNMLIVGLRNRYLQHLQLSHCRLSWLSFVTITSYPRFTIWSVLSPLS